MKPRQDSPDHSEGSNPQLPTDPEIEQVFQEVERSLQSLRDRYSQIQQAQLRQNQLQERREHLERELQQSELPALRRELSQLQEQLQSLELELESRLLSFDDLKRLFFQSVKMGILGDAFWQVVRFGGLGVLLGWLLKACAG